MGQAYHRSVQPVSLVFHGKGMPFASTYRQTRDKHVEQFARRRMQLAPVVPRARYLPLIDVPATAGCRP